ncbi:hypothetical protein M4J06_001530 [Streptomyces coelicoflavus]|uniref:hypothetical protein n=1 Tax=Streptomyces coelicoflavus TaxID=285562 RepID=UPI00210DD51D|nr:hypothetical protein [Streptomyces coelicoflavus]MCQ4203913.1 hypothetical protein [Streptomyces coelicoflavus]
MRKNGKTNSGQGGQGRARRWIALAARWSAALLSAYVPLVEQLPPLVPALLVNVLALLAGVHAFLPFDGAPGTVPTGEPTLPACRFDSARCVRTSAVRHPVRSVSAGRGCCR